MKCNVHVFYKMIFRNKFGFILETVFSYSMLACTVVDSTLDLKIVGSNPATETGREMNCQIH